MSAERTCGTCQSVRFTGPHELTLDGGRCAKATESGRDYVRAAEAGCPLWRRRRRARREADARRAAELAALVATVNARAQRGRR